MTTCQLPMMNNDKKIDRLWTIAAGLVFVILLVASYKYKTGLVEDITETAVVDVQCDLRKGSCQSRLPKGGTVSFSMTPNSIPILRPLKLEVLLKGIKAKSVQVDFVGIGMDMGYNRSTLEATDKKPESGHFMGKAVIPVCIRSKMDWEARVLLKTDRGLIMAPFRFYTIK